ncbi:hypothetical protein BH24CHL6_BH24CHL6_08650 [soil metagenome]
MRLLLNALATATARRPVTLLIVLGLVTIVLGGLASQQRIEADLTAFAPDTERNRALVRVQEDFGVGAGSTA